MVMKYLGFKPNSRLFVGKASAEIHPDAQQAAVEVGHGTPEVGDDPDKRIAVFQRHIVGHITLLKVGNDPLVLMLQIDGHGGFLGDSLEAFFGPGIWFCVEDGFDIVQSTLEIWIVEFAVHGITTG